MQLIAPSGIACSLSLGRRGRHNHIALDLHNVTLVDAVDACDDGVDSGPTIYTIKCAGIINDDSVSLMAVLAYQSERVQDWICVASHSCDPCAIVGIEPKGCAC